MLCFTGATKEALKSGLSDMEYLRSKVAQTEGTMKDEGEGVVQHVDSAYESGDRENISKTKTSDSSEDKKQGKAKKTAKQEVTIKMNPLYGNHIYSSACWLTSSSVCFRPSRQRSSL